MGSSAWVSRLSLRPLDPVVASQRPTESSTARRRPSPVAHRWYRDRHHRPKAERLAYPTSQRGLAGDSKYRRTDRARAGWGQTACRGLYYAGANSRLPTGVDRRHGARLETRGATRQCRISGGLPGRHHHHLGRERGWTRPHRHGPARGADVRVPGYSHGPRLYPVARAGIGPRLSIVSGRADDS